MITKGIVEEVVDKFKYRVRLPIFDRIPQSALSTKFDDLAIATACLPKGVADNIAVGDVVFVAFEDNNYTNPIVIGHLYREGLDTKEHGAIITARNLLVTEQTTLPLNTSIGSVTGTQIGYLLNVRSDVQEQIDELRKLITK